MISIIVLDINKGYRIKKILPNRALRVDNLQDIQLKDIQLNSLISIEIIRLESVKKIK